MKGAGLSSSPVCFDIDFRSHSNARLVVLNYIEMIKLNLSRIRFVTQMLAFP